MNLDTHDKIFFGIAAALACIVIFFVSTKDSTKCVNGVEYVTSSRSITPALNIDGTLRACHVKR